MPEHEPATLRPVLIRVLEFHESNKILECPALGPEGLGGSDSVNGWLIHSGIECFIEINLFCSCQFFAILNQEGIGLGDCAHLFNAGLFCIPELSGFFLTLAIGANAPVCFAAHHELEIIPLFDFLYAHTFLLKIACLV